MQLVPHRNSEEFTVGTNAHADVAEFVRVRRGGEREKVRYSAISKNQQKKKT